MGVFAKIGAERYGPSSSVGDASIFARLMGMGKTASGVIVSENNSLTMPAVFSAVGIISDAIAMLPADIYQKRDTGSGADEVKAHELSYLLNDKPNPYMSAFTLRQTRLAHQLLWGNGYNEIERTGGGKPVSLWPLLPDRTGPYKPAGGELYYKTTIDAKRYDLNKDNVLHVPGMGFDGYVGYSPVSLMRDALGMAKAMETFGGKFFANDAKSGGFLMHPGKLGDPAKDNVQKSMIDKGAGLENAHRVRILEEGMKFISTTIPPEDAQFLGSRSFQIAEIARIFRVPLFLLNSMEKSTSWGSGIEQMMLGFLMWTLQPWITREEQEMNAKLLTNAEREKGLFIKLNVNAIMRADIKSRSSYYREGIAAGWLTRNEARDKENYNPLPGLDKPLEPLNMQPAGGNTNDPEPREPRVPDDEDEGDDNES